MIGEALQSGDTGCRGVQAWDKKRLGTELTLGDTVAIDNQPMLTERTADLRLDKTGFRGNKQHKEIVSNMYVRYHIW